jgi:hypothetical protein
MPCAAMAHSPKFHSVDPRHDDTQWQIFVFCDLKFNIKLCKPRTGTLIAFMNSASTGGCQVCACGRSFYQVSAYTNHRRICKKTKNRLVGALEAAKVKWQRKRQRLDNPGDTIPGVSLASGSSQPADIVPKSPQVYFHWLQSLHDAHWHGYILGFRPPSNS